MPAIEWPVGRGIRRRQEGLSYLEVLVSTVIATAALAPALDALRNGAAAAGVHRGHLIDRHRLVSRIEEVTANRFATLDAEAVATSNSPTTPSTTYSDAPGTPNRIVVMLYRFDGSTATSVNTGLVRVDAMVEGSKLSLSTLRTQ